MSSHNIDTNHFCAPFHIGRRRLGNEGKYVALADSTNFRYKVGNVQGARVLADGIKKNRALTSVDITNNGCKDREFIDAIKCRANTQQCVGPLTELSCDDVIEWINKTRDPEGVLDGNTLLSFQPFCAFTTKHL